MTEEKDKLIAKFLEQMGDKLLDPTHNPRVFDYMWRLFNYYNADVNTVVEQGETK